MISLHRTPHGDLTDGDIVRYIDRECSPEEAQHIAAHLVGCDACRERVQVLERRLGVLSSLLVEADFGPDERSPTHIPPTRGWLKVAAVLLVSLGVGVSFTPVGAWVVETLARVVDGSGGALEQERAAPGYGVVSFAISGASLTIEIPGTQAGGELRLQQGDSGLASARVVRGNGSEELVVLPGVLRVLGNSASVADYDVNVPPQLTSVVIRVGEGEPLRVLVENLGERGMTLGLTGGR